MLHLIQRADIDSLQTAVTLYRGDFLAGATMADAPEFEAWLLQQRERLRLKFLNALERLTTLHLTAGHTAEAIETTRQLLQVEPWREAAHRQLMLLLARSGDYNGAIKQYQQCQAILATELGVDPMPETAALYRRIVELRQRPPDGQLPPLLSQLVGRESELATLTQLLADPAARLIAITGMGGIGKTSLALALAHQHARHFLDGVWFVSLADLAVDFQDMPLRHRSLRALFAHSWQQLTDDEQSALADLAVFRGGFSLEAAREVTAVARPVLHTLIAKSLLQEQNGRYAFTHSLIQRFALEKLTAATVVSERHAGYFSRMLNVGTVGELSLTLLLANLDNIRAMWRYAVTERRAALLGETAHGLARLYATINQFIEGRVLFAQAVEALAETTFPRDEPVLWGQLLGRYALFLLRTGQLSAAKETIERSVAVLRAAGDAEELAFSLNLLATVHIQTGLFDTAVPLLIECATLYRQLDKPALLLKPLVNLGSVEMRRGNYAAAIAHLDEALPLAQALNDQRGLTHIHNNLGANYFILGDLDAAYREFAACLPLTEATDYRTVRVVVEQNLAEVCYKQGNWAQAIRHCEASLAIGAEIGDPVPIIGSQKIYALALYAQGDRDRAWALLYEATEGGRQAAALPALLSVLLGAAQLWLAEGERDTAVELLQLIVGHPATEKQHIQEANLLLVQAGRATIEENGARPFDLMVEDVLTKLRYHLL